MKIQTLPLALSLIETPLMGLRLIQIPSMALRLVLVVGIHLLDLWDDFNDEMESRSLTLKEKEKRNPKIILQYSTIFCREWGNDPTYIKVMETVLNAHLRNAIDFSEALCYGIKQRKLLLRHKIEMDDYTSDDATVTEEDIKMEPTIRKPKGSDPRDYL